MTMSTITLERSHSCTPSTSHSMASPRPSQRDTPPSDAELSLVQMNDRVNQLDARFLELRSLVLTKDGYVDRRNREDEHIRREFENHRAVSDRIDMNVVSLRSDVSALRSDVTTLRSDVDRIDANLTTLQSDVSTLRSDMDKRFCKIEFQLDSKELKNFNYFARTIHAQVRPVPIVAEDGSAVWPQWFPRTVWRFWCLKKRSRLHRLIELAEFYQLGDYQDWSRVHSANQAPGDSDASDSNDYPVIHSRADAVRRFPEAAHQALGIRIGVAYHKLRLIVEADVGPRSVLPRPPKRQQEDIGSTSGKSKSKPVKMARRPNPAIPPAIQHLLPSASESKSSKSEEQDILGWKAFPDAPEDARGKNPSYDPNTLAGILRAVESGLRMLQPSASEKARMTRGGSKATSHTSRSHASRSRAADPEHEQVEVPTEPRTDLTPLNTVPTEPRTSLSDIEPAPGSDVPDTASSSESESSS